MKYIEIDEELYRHIASKTERIGESASEILRRLLGLDIERVNVEAVATPPPEKISQPGMDRQQEMASSATARVDETTAPAISLSTLVNQLTDTEALAQQKGAVGRFLFSLETVYKAMPQQFDQVLQIQGRDRLYFATSKASLLKASKSANPKEIGQSGFWVTTNNNTAKKRTILSEVLTQFGVDPEQVELIVNQI
ncbi:replication initiation negative regulator SeqA [Shewanella algidipiscicola]|uniref:Negative modulator of initiation of replication n=1 Tax=Shewanella algidipiscicola TaxID=614070 RepID=A0ABQ4PHS7_9GAMM|nr:replication initiation negative regulator SeqA [Shewanella algidipiscicola]GIU47115.1 negative modulator of initiation of replication [Shewanella algidipiscicola]